MKISICSVNDIPYFTEYTAFFKCNKYNGIIRAANNFNCTTFYNIHFFTDFTLSTNIIFGQKHDRFQSQYHVVDESFFTIL
ncbi:unnamed protein product [Schistosoma curassoni]|uniref:Uncharacterized protein n=1 Tax=Schistosoma curassoni TaxID=6186 RepID=A0A183KD54_9TREM|nr:unnamed protein product [Schistosoma curassoni]